MPTRQWHELIKLSSFSHTCILAPFLLPFSLSTPWVKAGHSLKMQQCAAAAMSQLQMKANTSGAIGFTKH